MSPYQQMKPFITDFLMMSRDAVHIHIGFACLVIMLLRKKSLTDVKILLPGLILSILMELMDLRDDYNLKGRMNFLASLHDLINTNFIPVVLFILVKYKKLQQTPS